MRKPIWWVPVVLVAFASCGPLSSRDKPGQGGGGSLSEGAPGGEGATPSGGKAHGDTPTSGAGGTSGSASGGVSAGGGEAGAVSLPLQGGVGGEGGVRGVESVGGEGGAGGEPEPVGPVTIATGQLGPTGITVDATTVYWANHDAGTIVSCPLRGCGSSEPTVLVSGTEPPYAVAVDATDVYWISRAPSAAALLFKCPLGGCSVVPPHIASFSPNDASFGLHLAGGMLYVAAWPKLGICSVDDCSTQTDTGPGPFVAVDGDAEFLYLSRYGHNQLQRCPLAGCSTATGVDKLASDVKVLGVAVDATHVYFTDNTFYTTGTTHQISRCPLAGCGAETPELVLGGDVSPYGLAQRRSRLYFTDVVQGTVISLPKPP